MGLSETPPATRFDYREACDLNRDGMRQWVDYCRSGTFPQTRGALRDADGYCCLGVACEVAIANGIDLSYATDHRGSDWPGVAAGYWASSGNRSGRFPEDMKLPRSVFTWLGLANDNPIIAAYASEASAEISARCLGSCGFRDGWPYGHLHATTANDRLKWPLPKIGDAIEAYYGLAEEVAV